MIYKIETFWDNEAQVLVVNSDQIFGLATQADTLELLTYKLKVMIP